MLRQESRVKLRRDSNVSSNRQVITISYIKIVLYPIKSLFVFLQGENNLDEKGSLGNYSRESLREKLSVSDSFHGHVSLPLVRATSSPPVTSVTSPVSLTGSDIPEIPRILVHALGREETIESTLSSDTNTELTIVK